jgi:hypothetical protein
MRRGSDRVSMQTIRGGWDRASMQRRAKARPTALVTQRAVHGWPLRMPVGPPLHPEFNIIGYRLCL